MYVTFKNKTKECLCPWHLNAISFREITQLRENLFQGKQRELINTKECSEDIYFSFKS